MTAPIGSAAASGAAAAATSTKIDAKAKATAEVKQAAAAFEAILVKQMLASSSVAGKGSYSDMGVEALSSAVTAGGGLGLGHAIEQAVGDAHRDASKKTSIP